VIYFLTDGLFTDVSSSDLKKMSHASSSLQLGGFFKRAMRSIFGDEGDSGPAPTIHTITLDDPSGAQACKEIADKFGGRYIHAKSKSE